MRTVDIKQKQCRNTSRHHAHGVTTTHRGGDVSGYYCPGRYTTQPSDPFAGIDENTESDARRPAVS